MKTTKKIFLSILCTTPFIVATPMLLTSCGYVAVDKDNNAGEENKPNKPNNPGTDNNNPGTSPELPEENKPNFDQSGLEVLKTWSLLSANKTYTNSDRNDNKPVYLFKSGTSAAAFNFENASNTIKKLVTNSIYSGNIIDVKTKKASQAIAANFEAVTTNDSKKSTYVLKGFDLSQQSNFELISTFIANQKFDNLYTENNNESSANVYETQSMWFTSDKYSQLKTILSQFVKCDISVSLTETGNSNENVKYTTTFTFAPKYKDNWPGKNDGNPIQIETEFEIRNFISLFKNKELTTQTSMPVAEYNRGYRVFRFYAGLMTNTNLDVTNEVFKNNSEIMKLFAKNGNSASSSNSEKILTLNSAQVDAQKVTSIFKKIPSGKLINYEENRNGNLVLQTAESSLPYILGNPTKNTNNDPVFDGTRVYVDTVQLNNLQGNRFITINIKCKEANYKWFWGSWKELYDTHIINTDSYNTRDLSIRINLDQNK